MKSRVKVERMITIADGFKWHPRMGIPLALFLVCGSWLVSCTGKTFELTGGWVATEITHPSTFFSKTLDREKHSHFTLLLTQSGEFMWLDPEGECRKGRYLVQGTNLVLTESNSKPIILTYVLRGDRLQLKSPDGFVFEFLKEPKGSYPDFTPCETTGKR